MTECSLVTEFVMMTEFHYMSLNILKTVCTVIYVGCQLLLTFKFAKYFKPHSSYSKLFKHNCNCNVLPINISQDYDLYGNKELVFTSLNLVTNK